MTTTTAVAFDIESLIEMQRASVRRREYTPLGTLEKIMFEASKEIPLGGNSLAKNPHQSCSLDWYGKGPLLAFSNQGELLIVGLLPKPPAIPQPGWLPPPDWAVGARKVGGQWPLPPKPPKVEQLLRDRASGILPGKNGDKWLVFQPVHQILLVLQDRSGWGDVKCHADPSGRHVALLYNPKTQEGHFLFGVLKVDYCRG